MLLTTDDLKMKRRLQKQWCKCDALLVKIAPIRIVRIVQKASLARKIVF